MATVIKRNDTLESLLKYWNHNNPSFIGIGRLTRKLNDDSIYIINKTYGRKDLALFNINTATIVSGEIVESKRQEQVSLEPRGLSHNFKEQNAATKLYISNWIQTNKEELCIQLHYLNWFDKIEIKDLVIGEVIKVLESYSYDQQEAELLFNNLTY